MTPQIGPSPSLPTPTVAPPLVEGGMMAAIVLYLLKTGFEFFRRKDVKEEQLTEKLIDDLREKHDQQLQQIGKVLAQLESSHKEIAIAVSKMSIAISDINLAAQQNSRIHSEIFAQLRSLERMMLNQTNSSQSNGKSSRQPGNRSHG